ncbi:MAG: hypothetical protein DA446_05670 [Bacteroidetes bacterium]|jgi:biopolymer transport protein ExbD|nr:MAG: hypothetical protein DA443_04395 [Bacteroidota bacterium]PTM19978.1 MAG: hypothetical protein DA446_05670 [Bacteroidota bacterium]
MSNGSFLIRFIDIGLLLLFGFIIISDITVRTQLELPSTEEEVITNEEGEREITLLIIQIENDNTFRVMDSETEELLIETETSDQLEPLLTTVASDYRDRNIDIIILIQPGDETIMQSLIYVMDICDRLGIPRNINVPSLRL